MLASPTSGRRAFVTATLALAIAACTDSINAPGSVPPPLPDAPTSGDVSTTLNMTTSWNQLTRNTVVKYATGAAPAVRIYTLVAVAQERATRAVTQRPGQQLRVVDAAAIGAASVDVLRAMYPAESTFLANTLTAQLATIESAPTTQPSITAGLAAGRLAAADVLAHAASEGFFTPFTGVVPNCPGCWKAVPTPPAFATLGQARPWLLNSTSQFRPAPPPAFGSAAFLAGLAEIRAFADHRTPAQDSIAKVWALQNGTVTTLGYWNALASEFSNDGRLSDRRAAHILALVNMAGYDALLASHEAKYTYWVLRPSQADPLINMAIGLPSFPAYPSNHAAISAAAATVLAAVFPQERMRVTDDAEMAGLSRLYGGIHYRFDMEAGLALGRKVGRVAVSVLEPSPVEPPIGGPDVPPMLRRP